MTSAHTREPRRLDQRVASRFAGGMLALALLSASASGFAANATLDQVMALLAQRKHGEVRYVEEDYLQILDQPVKSSGVLVYDAPDHLEKRALKPKPESLILDGERLTVERGHRTYRMDLGEDPQVAPFVDSIRDTLAGNEQALERVFKVTFTGTLEEWQLELVPLDEKVARKVSQVQIAGARDEIHSVKILQTDGDRSV
ncbi:MAG TPA: LolA-related protein, partial [Steroidobacteraceae bacterium]|nr:LolA-related protein [Steroidobacteraceae bacterium]